MPENMLTIIQPCSATIIPAGDIMQIPQGSEVEIVQALGGSLTVKHKGILLRIDPTELHRIDPAQLQEIPGMNHPDLSAKPHHDAPFSENLLWDTLKSCYDPEIPVNIVDLGLIFDMVHSEAGDGQHDVSVKMTLTAQGCGMGPVIAEDARNKLEALSCIRSANVEIVWDPPWTPHMISPEGRIQLGLT